LAKERLEVLQKLIERIGQMLHGLVGASDFEKLFTNPEPRIPEPR